MTIEIKVPMLPESVTDATIAKWYKKVGDTIARDENLVDLETDKVMLEVPAPKSGVIEKIIVTEGSVVKAGEMLAIISEGAVSKPMEAQAPAKPTPQLTPIGNTSSATPSATNLTSTIPADLTPSERRAV